MAGTKTLSAPDNNGLKITNLADGTAATDAATKGQVDTASTADRSRANHTGTQSASTISDFDTQVRSSRLDQMSAPTNPVAFNGQRITGLADPTSAQDAATRAYVDTALGNQTAGLTLKGAVRVATTTNVTIASPGAAVDGVTLVNGDLLLLMGQSTGSQNGPWVFNGASSALTRPANFDTSAEAVLGSFWIVREGTYADAFAVLTNDTAITLGTTALTFIVRGQATATTGSTGTCPSTAAGGSWVHTHNLGTRAVVAQVARVASPYDVVDVRIERTTINTVTMLPDVALAAGEFEVMVSRVV